METRTPRPRFWIALQPSIVRVYKVAGLVALTAILIGLLGFLVVNIFYFFDHSWVRPTILTANHPKVIEASQQLGDANVRLVTLQSDKLDAEHQLKHLEDVITTNQKFLADVAKEIEAPRSPEQWVLRREADKAKLDLKEAEGKRVPLQQRLDGLRLRIDDQDRLVKQLQSSPYLKGRDSRVVLAFVPNSNTHVKVGTKLYGCSWGLVACSNVGKVTNILEGEVTGTHPHDDSIQRGIMVEIDVSPGAATDSVLFAGSKPLWLF
ncbi:MAG: hypothetical protein KIT31_15480 [Deltaproteobacteria bacterium]|nr:hypothetical protein [Deltaproteobacteria bacterium]